MAKGDAIKTELDTLFKKSKKSITKTPTQTKSAPEKPAKASKPVKKEKSAPVKAKPAASKPRKRTEEGFLVYTEEELGIGKGGNTEDCPFDCDCCF